MFLAVRSVGLALHRCFQVDGLLTSYLNGFDIVLVEDQTMHVPDLILQALLSSTNKLTV